LPSALFIIVSLAAKNNTELGQKCQSKRGRFFASLRMTVI